MTLRMHVFSYLALLSIFTSLPASARSGDDAILFIEQTTGVAGVQRDGKRLALNAGDALQEQDLIVTDRSGRMILRLGRHGFVEVGPNSEVGVERLPYAAYARDLKSIFSVGKGYFRVVWKHPQLSTNWPLYVYMAGHRISLVSGEYFFQNLGQEQRVCVAAGELALQVAGGDGVESIKPPSCVGMVPNEAARVTPRNPDDWIAVRRAFSIAATAASMQAREASPAEPPAPVIAKPIINTAPTTIASVAAPTAIADANAAAANPGTGLAAEPEVKTSSAARALGPGQGPVAAAPVLTAPAPAPRTTLSPALPVFTPPIGKMPAATTTAPIIIGQVQTPPLLAAPPPAAQAPVPPPTPAPAANATGSWALNIASYSEVGVAEQEAARLRAAGYPSATTQPASVNGKTWHRVQIRGFASEPVARSAAQEIKDKLGLKSIWVVKP